MLIGRDLFGLLSREPEERIVREGMFAHGSHRCTLSELNSLWYYVNSKQVECTKGKSLVTGAFLVTDFWFRPSF